MLLGTLLKHAMRAQGAFDEQIAARDARLAARLSAEAERLNMEPRDFIADTMRRFMGAEDSEGWTTILGNLQRADDPGYAFIETAVRQRLSHRCDH